MSEIAGATHVIYHRNCRDGFGAAWAAYRALGFRTPNGQPVIYTPAQYGEEPPETDPNGWVYILDFSYDAETLGRLWHRHEGRLTLLDHHESSMQRLQGEIPGCHFDMNRSGAVMAWEYFMPGEPLPDLLAYVQDRDLWQWKLPDSREINAALEQAEMDFSVWDRLNVTGLAIQGAPLIEPLRARARELARQARYTKVAGYWVPTVETDELVSETGELLLKLYPHARFAALYSEAEDGGLKYSLRADGRTNVAEIANQMGGGGHPNAAGFKTNAEGIQEDTKDRGQ